MLLITPLVGVYANEDVKPAAPKKATEFKDVLRTHDSFVAISYLHNLGIINGYSDENFKPDNAINRAEALKIILKSLNIAASKAIKEMVFSDVDQDAWFAPYVYKAKTLGIVSGNDKTGKFSPSKQVNKAEFLKMFLVANKIKIPEVKKDQVIAVDVPQEKWFTPYMSYALGSGIVSKNSKGLLKPQKLLTRAEVVDIIYLLFLIKSSKDTQFLLHRAEAELAQVEIYIAANKMARSKTCSEIAVDLTQQAYKNMPKDKVVLGAAKLARSYDWLVDSFIYGINKDYVKASEFANKAIDKATEAWNANNATQPIARHIKDRAREILKQVGGTEE